MMQKGVVTEEDIYKAFKYHNHLTHAVSFFWAPFRMHKLIFLLLSRLVVLGMTATSPTTTFTVSPVQA
jgi:hypothetical protein